MDKELTPFILYHGPINGLGASQVEDACLQLAPHLPKHLTLLICSGGGDVNAGVGLYNFLKMLPFEVRTHTFGICGSIAATIYLAGVHRTAAPTSIFTLHAASFIEGPRKGQISENTQLISKPFRTEIGWDENRVAAYFGSADENYITVENAVEFGMVHEISVPVLAPDSTVIKIDPNRPAPISLALGSTAAA